MTPPVTLDDEVAGLDAVHVGPADGGHGGRLLFVHGLFGGAWMWERVLDYFAARPALGDPILIGHSLGGLLVLKVAEQTSRRTMNRLAFNRLDAAGRERAWRRIVPESGRRALGVAVPGLAVDPRRLTCPRLIVSAGADRLTPAPIARKIARRYGAECYHYETLGHMVTLEPGWTAVAADVDDWLCAVPALRHGWSHVERGGHTSKRVVTRR